MLNARLFLLGAAAICFFVAAIGLNTGRMNAVALGLFFWVSTLFLRA
jgi:hypothetical protein